MAGDSLKKGRYSEHGNKIGLHSKDGFINASPDVVLEFPFKDCVLEAGMSKEDTGREERFLHIKEDQENIDTLTDPKVLTAFRYVSQKNERKLTAKDDIEFFDADGELKQNLLIKGNNLLALHTLREKLAGQIKLIYIDPPYNTGSDGFKYNDNFNHSSWLVFMKNRLEAAKELLRDDGVIFVHCDDNEQAYLKVLMDEILGRENFLTNVVVVSDARTRSYSAISTTHEFVLAYGKSKDYSLYQLIDDSKKFPYHDEEGGFELYELRNRNASFNVNNRPNLFYPFYLNPKNELKNGLYELSLTPKNGWVKVLPQKSGGIQTVWRQAKITVLPKLNTIIFGKKAKQGYQIVKKYRETTKSISTVWNEKELLTDRGTLEVKALFNGKKVFDFPKPETTLRRIVEIATQPGDLVLDFCAGSGTTLAVAHKMGRRWIGVEQMDYIETITLERLKKVLDGESGGISKSVNWQGGGAFVYLELKKYNQEFVERINKSKSKDALNEVYREMAKNAFLKFWFDKNEFEKDENFISLDLPQRKQKLIEILDTNQLYLNYAEIDDKRHRVSSDEKALTMRFYGE